MSCKNIHWFKHHSCVLLPNKPTSPLTSNRVSNSQEQFWFLYDFKTNKVNHHTQKNTAIQYFLSFKTVNDQRTNSNWCYTFKIQNTFSVLTHLKLLKRSKSVLKYAKHPCWSSKRQQKWDENFLMLPQNNQTSNLNT